MYKAVRIALDEVGYLEKKSNAYLDDKTKNAGYNNFTKYARDLDALGDFYNFQKQTRYSSVPWCEIFVDWCFVQAYSEDLALKMLYQPRKSAGAGCTQSAAYYKAAGAFYSTPKEGDQIYFSWGGDVEHTGLVWSVDGTHVYTVEGNTSGASGVVANGGGVCRKSYSLTDPAIYGYGRPNYRLASDYPAPEPEPKPEPEKPIDEGDVFVNVTLRQLSRGCVGDDVKAAQRLLVGAGFGVGSAGIDGDFGNDTRNAVIRFQKSRGLVGDGIIGAKTYPALLGVK